MPKDAKGHGSNAKPIAGSPFHKKSDAELKFIAKDAAEAGRNAQQMGDERGVNKYADQVADAATVMGYRARGGLSDHPNDVAARALASGPKAGTPPVHEAMGGRGPDLQNMAGHLASQVSSGAMKPTTFGRHGYNPDSVNSAIAAQNRSGRGKIGGKEASMIHRLMRGRG